MGLNRQNLEIRLNQTEKSATDLHGCFYKRDSVKPEIHRRTFDRTQGTV